MTQIIESIASSKPEELKTIAATIEGAKQLAQQQIIELDSQGSETRSFGSKYFKWASVNGHITAWTRQEKPYPHNCPTIHLKTIMKTIVEILKTQGIINKEIVFSKLENKELSPERLFKGKAEQYKIYMALGILEIEGLLKWTGSERPIEFISNSSPETIQKWIDEKII